MKLTEALKMKSTTTENGMSTNTTSLSFNVDLFFKAGAMRNANEDSIISLVSKAWVEDPTSCLRILFWARDVRGGAGERRFFKIAIKYLADKDPQGMSDILGLIPEFGRWDDLLIFEDTHSEEFALSIIDTALSNKNGLCAKWMPRKGTFATKLRRFMGLSPKDYRKCLVELTKVVETQMCAKEWDKIEFGKLPSVASARYQKAFGKNAYETYSAYIQSLVKGEAKINASAVYPYDVTKSLKHGNETVASEQWKALPNYLENNTERILPLVDVSGSMDTSCGGNITCMDVAISLGLYISERNEGPFKDHFITFSDSPRLQHLTGNLNDRFDQMSRADWGMSTNLQAAYELILKQAVKHKISQDEMPTQILILSDMEFNAATNSRGGWYSRAERSDWNPTAHEMVRKMFTDAGYELPNIIYWNIQSRGENVPVRFDEQGTALISGFSPSIMTSLLSGANMSPVSIMMETIGKERYSCIKYETTN
jgi:hypothetical protein